ncbi:MAG: SPFH domain-containing protein [Planctomycetes bacterium]|nr:SPFH domain-containing protein [Planctomycetota bacterium]
MSQERVVSKVSGFLVLPLLLCDLAAVIWCFVQAAHALPGNVWKFVVGAVAGIVLFLLLVPGLFVVNPNESRVLVLFGGYTGTVKQNGFFWVNPFTMKHTVSLRAHTLNGEKIKVNDKSGNPIEIAAVVVWQVRDTYAAKFDVDDFLHYVETQSEAAVRKLASAYHYDGTDDETTLRGDTETVNEHLRRELEERFSRAGIHVLEARIAHLAYAPEIAQAMLQRQQASAVVAARTKIVEGAVGMVQMALEELARKEVVDLDPERRAAMVSSLLVVLCGERTTPVVNVGTLYT